MVNKITLDNGVRIVSEQIESLRSVSIGIWVGTGSRNEEKEENGISHFLEHMFFKGTEKRNPQEIAESFDQIGGQVNAFTSKEYTCFYAKVLDEHAPKALDVLSDMFFHSTFDTEELMKEKNVVLEEIKMVDDTPDDIVHDILGEASYGNHPLGLPILGTADTLNTFSRETLQGYLERYYTGENVVISIAGNIKEDMIEQISSVFSELKPKGADKNIEKPTFLTNKMAREKETEQAHLCLGYPGVPAGDESIYALALLNNVLGGSMSSRLFQEIREKRGLAYSVFSYHSSFQDNGMLTIYGGTAPGHLDELFDATVNCIKDLRKKGLTKKELTNGKEQLKGNLMLSLESSNSRMSRNGKNELLLGYHRSLDEVIQQVNKVTEEDVLKVASEVFIDDFSLSLISPTGRFPSSLSK
ncbi:M16 family metallopeptidase [Bacillus sp. FJAT-44742]|uniref:M16 family metallopeptidase n=1 Tax=Bacillus sp. FJAT-44742 TaxID=2014005 RepID=UPI000C2306C6|nr:pitrilysin family protein [Bacillus sp. FJAT-44742]